MSNYNDERPMEITIEVFLVDGKPTTHAFQDCSLMDNIDQNAGAYKIDDFVGFFKIDLVKGTSRSVTEDVALEWLMSNPDSHTYNCSLDTFRVLNKCEYLPPFVERFIDYRD